MKTYIVLLRGINVAGQKKLKMAELRKLLHHGGFTEISTYIQSGNVVLKSDAPRDHIEKKIAQDIHNVFGFELNILVKPYADFQRIFDNNPFNDPEDLDANRIYFVLLKTKAQDHRAKAFSQESYRNEKFDVSDECVYLACMKGYGKAKLNNNVIERKLQVAATTRNYKTMYKLLQMAKDKA